MKFNELTKKIMLMLTLMPNANNSDERSMKFSIPRIALGAYEVEEFLTCHIVGTRTWNGTAFKSMLNACSCVWN